MTRLIEESDATPEVKAVYDDIKVYDVPVDANS